MSSSSTPMKKFHYHWFSKPKSG